MPGRYGVATAGSRTAGDPCASWPFCSASDYNAWREAGKKAAKAMRALVKEYKLDGKLPPELATKAAEANVAAEYFEGWGPIIIFQADVESAVQQQQTILDFAGQVADWLESKGIKPPDNLFSANVLPASWWPYLAFAAGAVLVGGGVYYVMRPRAVSPPFGVVVLEPEADPPVIEERRRGGRAS